MQIESRVSGAIRILAAEPINTGTESVARLTACGGGARGGGSSHPLTVYQNVGHRNCSMVPVNFPECSSGVLIMRTT